MKAVSTMNFLLWTLRLQCAQRKQNWCWQSRVDLGKISRSKIFPNISRNFRGQAPPPPSHLKKDMIKVFTVQFGRNLYQLSSRFWPQATGAPKPSTPLWKGSRNKMKKRQGRFQRSRHSHSSSELIQAVVQEALPVDIALQAIRGFSHLPAPVVLAPVVHPLHGHAMLQPKILTGMTAICFSLPK